MPPQSPTSLQFDKQNHTNRNLSFIIAEQFIHNLSQTIVDNNIDMLDYDNTNSSLVRYKTLYRNYHGIISSFVCIFGLTCNLFNIIVLTRPLMRSSTNTILTSLALSDLIKMLFVLPAAIFFYCLQSTEHKSEPDFSSRFQVTFYMIQMLVTLTLHCISTWLTVLLAGFRYVFLSCKTLTAYVSTPDRALIGVSAVVIVSTILCIPSYIEHRLAENHMNDTYFSTNTTTNKPLKSYRFDETALSKYLNLRDTVFVLHGVIFKLIPCALLLLFSFLLIQQLRDALKKSEKLQTHSILPSSAASSGRIRGRRREKENRRTTLMLVIVCALFLVTELPQGAILLLSFISKTNSKYYYTIYQQLGDTFDILALINNSVNFILYCLMSRAFRDTFKQTFCFGCQKTEGRESAMSFAQLSISKHRQKKLTPGIVYEHVSSYKSSDEKQLNSTVSENNHQKKKTSLQILNNSTTIPLINDKQLNGLIIKNSCPS
ncbi:unnamed protein product [Adineta steineri]|uniref:G-protein coupled receptors family 1 profile domain-containing protein n=1 Tax=Adineta steineri TaxID=433720 RepID=A0A815KUB9_9BILA|nr:unnamed protein product [Adineta steineri]CAF3919616.1 unnamed protein product [Adineta steineri]